MIVYLIGGGPSCADLCTQDLKGGYRIAINDAAFHKPADAFFSNDHGYALRIADQIKALTIPVHLSVRHRHWPQFEGWKAAIWRRVDEIEPSTKEGVLSSGPAGTPGCSGYVALNLAAQMGAKQIVLFGYDFQDDYRYFFQGPYPRVHIPEVRESFRKVAKWYARNGIEILNANPDSAIDAFPRISHNEALRLHENRSYCNDGAARA